MVAPTTKDFSVEEVADKKSPLATSSKAFPKEEPPVLKSVPQPKLPEAHVILPVVESQVAKLAPKKLVVLAVVAKKLVVVALVVVELVERRLGKVLFAVVVAVKLAATVSPTIESLAYGDVVPMPTLPVGVMTKRLPLKSPILFTSIRFCVTVGLTTPVITRAAEPEVLLSVLMLTRPPRLPEPAT